MTPPAAAEPRSELPFIDEHQVLVAAPAPCVWQALVDEVGHAWLSGAGPLAVLLGTEPRSASGAPFDEGATLPGFRVEETVPDQRVRLTGRHRFSRYALTLTLAPHDGGTTLTASTHAAFPGLHGTAYRGLVIGTGIHRTLTRRLLEAVRRRAERATS